MPAEPTDRTAVDFSVLLRSFTRLVSARPWLTLLVLVGMCVAAGVYTSRQLKFKSDRADLIDPKAEFQQRWLRYTEEFGEGADIVVVVEVKPAHAESTPDAKELITPVLDDLGQRLKSDSKHFQNVLYRVEHEHLKRKGLQFLNPSQLEMLLAQMDELRPVIEGDWDRVNLETVVHQLLQRWRLLQLRVATMRSEASSLPGPSTQELMQMIGQHVAALATSMAQALRNPADASNPWPQLISVDGDLASAATKPTYLLNDRGTQGFIQLVPVIDKSDFNGATAAVQRLRDLVNEVQQDFPDVRIGLTGIPVLENDEMLRSQKDMTLSTVVSFVGVLLLLLAGFHGVRHPLIATAMLGIGLVLSFAFAAGSVGHLNILSASFAPIMMGLGCDYAIMYLSRYLELRHANQGLDEALENTSASVGPSILMAAVTTSLAFYCATFTKFLGIAELGIISAGGILLCVVSSFLALPALIKVADRNIPLAKLPTPIEGNWLRKGIRFHPWFVAIMGLSVLGFLGGNAFDWTSGRPRFAVDYDCNLLNLQAKGVESVDWQDRIFKESRGSLLFAVSVADSPEEARQLKAKFAALPTVSKVEELAGHFPSSPADQTKLLIQAIHAEVSRLAPVKYEPREVNPEAIGQLVERLYQMLEHNPALWAQRAKKSLDEFLNQFSKLPLERQVKFLNEFQAKMNFALHGQLEALAAASHPEPITLADFPAELASRFVSSSGKWLLQVYPKEQIWDIEPLQRFVEDVRSIDPEATGTPLQNFEASQQIKQSYQDAAAYALLAIWVTLVIDLLGREQAFRVLVPPACVLAVVYGICAWQNLQVSWSAFGILYLAMTVIITAMIDFAAVIHSLLALLPSLGGAAIMFGVMRMLHVDLNPANLIVLPLLLGLGMDGGVHIVHDFRLQTERAYRISPSIINSLVLTSTTTMVGFGSMLLAAHRGLYSFGLVLTIGVAASVFVALVPLPAILTLLDPRRRTDSLVDWDTRENHSVTDSIVSPNSTGLTSSTPMAFTGIQAD